MNPLQVGAGWSTYLAAAGLLGYALYQVSTGDYPAAVQSFFAALAAFGIRRAVANEGVKQEAILRQSLAIATRAERP